MDLTNLALLAFLAAFVVSVVDYFVDLGISRAGIAVGVTAAATIPLEILWWQGLVMAMAASFVAMFLLQVVERLNYRPGRVR
jgi:hypothetical protein